jgi:hypothetical protein
MSTAVSEYRRDKRLRVLFALGITQEFFSLSQDAIRPVMEACKTAFDGLEERFGVTVLGTLDDDETLVGARDGWPWTCYILAEAPDREAVTKVCNQLRETRVDDAAKLWKYLTIEARMGRPLFFAEG